RCRTVPPLNEHLRGARRVGTLAARVLQRASGYGPERLPSPPRNATGVPRFARRNSRRGERLRGRKATRLSPAWSFRRGLSRPLRRAAIRHVAERLGPGHVALAAARPGVKFWRRPIRGFSHRTGNFVDFSR